MCSYGTVARVQGSLRESIRLMVRRSEIQTNKQTNKQTGNKQTEAVIDHCVRLAWYLVDTEENCVLTYRKSPYVLDLTGTVDAIFANDPLTKRSYFGYVLTFGANPIAWK